MWQRITWSHVMQYAVYFITENVITTFYCILDHFPNFILTLLTVDIVVIVQLDMTLDLMRL